MATAQKKATEKHLKKVEVDTDPKGDATVTEEVVTKPQTAEERIAELEAQLAILFDAKETLDNVREDVNSLLNEEVEELAEELQEKERKGRRPRGRKRNNSPKAKAKRALRALDRKARKHVGPIAFVAGAASGAGAATVVHKKKDDVREAGEKFRNIKGVEADFEVSRKSA